MNKILKSKIVLKFGTQEDFAQAVGESPSIVSYVIRGRRRLSVFKWHVLSYPKTKYR